MVSVNDAFVYLFMFPILDRSSTDLDDCSMKAWASALDPSNASGVSELYDTLLRLHCTLSVHLSKHILWFILVSLSRSSHFITHHLQIRFLADPAGEFTRTLDLAFDGGAVFGGDRSKRYALVVEDGKVKQVHVEPDNTGVDGMYFSLA